MPSLDRVAADYGGISLDDDLIVVHLLLVGFDMHAPSLDDARDWASHDRLTDRSNHVVLVGDPRMLGSETFGMIPGLQVVDRNFVLRYDAAGRGAPHDLWTDLWPGVAGVLAGS